MYLSRFNKANFISTSKFLLVMPWALFARLWDKDVWIITERSDQARDNGYCFYRYVRTKYPKLKIIYIIDTSVPDYEKVQKYGSVIRFDSWAHYYYYCLSKIHISAHVGGCKPSNSPLTRYIKRLLSIKDIFLPHGVSYGVAEFCLKKYAKIDLFICSGFPEYKNVLENYGYTENEVAYTGFPRLDLWHDICVNPKQIVLMPTWRLYIAQHPEIDIHDTLFYKTYQAFINDERLVTFLEKNGLELIVYLHHEMQKYAKDFSTRCAKIRIIQPAEQCDIQKVLMQSALLVTDYSSVHFDFAYMNKPVIYYQFDKEEFFAMQYSASDFSFEQDGFGPVCYESEDIVDNLVQFVEKGYPVEDIYSRRMRKFYRLYDENNCERVYRAIRKCERRKNG